MDHSAVQALFNALSVWVSEYLLISMAIVFLAGLALRTWIYAMMKSEERFALEFEKRVHRHLGGDYQDSQGLGFIDTVKTLLDRTLHESFTLMETRRRRSFDPAISLSERVMMTRDGAHRAVEDCLRQARYCEAANHEPDFNRLSRYVFGTNPFYNKILGRVPLNRINDWLAILPGLFIVIGIFGTFVGIVSGLPALKTMDVTNVTASSQTLNVFLESMTFAIMTSVFGVGFSILFTLLNTLMSPEPIYVSFIERFEHALSYIWKDSHLAQSLKGKRGKDHDGKESNNLVELKKKSS